MLSYEVLDTIADSYNPLLALIALIFIVKALLYSQWKLLGLRLAAFFAVAITAYGLMFLDNRLNIWSYWGLDYSTHTAIAVGLVLFLSFVRPQLRIWWFVSFIGYVLLMLYQRYHTIADILTTGITVSIPLLLAFKILLRLERSLHKAM